VLFQEQEIWMLIMNWCMILCTYLLLRPILYVVKETPDDKNIKTYIMAALCSAMLFCMFSFWGEDWFHYQEFFEKIKITGESDFFEDFYIYLIEYLCPHYMFFRLFVWGLALLLLVFLFRVTKVNLAILLFMFTTVWLPIFSYARASLSMSALFLGGALLVYHNDKKHLTNITLGILCLVASFLFHKSAIYGIVLVLGCLPFYNKRVGVFLPFIIVPTLFFIIKITLSALDLSGDSGSEGRMELMSSVGNQYLNSIDEGGDTTKGWLLAVFLERVSYYLLALMSFIMLWKQKLQDNKVVKLIAYFLLWNVAISSLFAFDYGVNTSVFYGRFLRFSIIPSTIVIAYMYDKEIFPRAVRYIYMTAFVGTLYMIGYILISLITH